MLGGMCWRALDRRAGLTRDPQQSRGAIMKNASWGDILLTWMEALRAWLLQQSWLGFAHDWIASAAPEMIWLALIVLAAVLVVGIGFCWPRRRRA
jgi:hypothetical protein